MNSLSSLRKDLQKLANPQQAKNLQRFFKTGPGEYGEGGKFLGIKVPLQRQVAKAYPDLSLLDLKKLIRSSVHEERLTGLFILVKQYQRASKKEDQKLQKKLYDFYLANAKFINNWDLVDSSAPYVVGHYLFDKPRHVLLGLTKSPSLWERRIAIIATAYFIREGDFKDTLKIARVLLKDENDLIHRAVGWMLREVGNKNQAEEERFLKRHASRMPRTMLRYAIEKFSPQKRKYYLQKK